VVCGPAGDFDVPVAVLLPPIHAHTPLFRVTGLPPNLTIRALFPVMLPEVALMVVLPAATPLATTLVIAPVLIVAAARLLLDQVTVDVQSELVPFE
jgi:hypothetical protein